MPLLLLVIRLTGAAEAASPADSPSPRQLISAAAKPAPAFVLPDLDGSPLRLQNRTGQIVLVHFFATWCEPCREELASLSRLIEGPLGKRLAILAINVAEVPSRVRRFLDSVPVNFPIGLDSDRAVTRAWGVSALPTTFVLDAHLQPRLFVEGDVDWMRPDIIAALEAFDAVRVHDNSNDAEETPNGNR
ncbi:MAG: TlpA disulfide reductase family protein [Hyphomicrobiaceae bacterium]